jgi:transcriptional regulator with XRE-family HTH domain
MEQVTEHPRSGTTSLSLASGEGRRRELASFLRRRREGVVPEAVGMPRTARRRVSGLRREEVAEAAGISAAWYTWIEQAREVNLSLSTLNGISRALRLNEDERAHLFELAGQPIPVPEARQDDEAIVSLQAMLGALDPNPAYAVDSQWQIIAWNKGAETIFGDLSAIPAGDRNYLKLIFTSPGLRELFVNWEEVARCSLAHFRSDSAGNVDDVRWDLLVSDLKKQSRTFREWWTHHDVAWPHSWRKELRLPHGNRVFNTFDLALLRPMRLRIVTYIPAAEG